MKNWIFIVILYLGMISCNNSHKTSEIAIPDATVVQNDSLKNSDTAKIAHQIAKAQGIQNWKAISKISFTFNVDRNGNHFERSWIWKPKTHDIQMISGKDTVSYNRSKLDTVTMKTDAAFINDKYWLLAPFQLVWDKGMEFSIKENQIAPISKDTLEKLSIVYPDQGGYTPGDAYDLFYDKNFKIREWTYRKGNTSEPSLTTTWEDYNNFDGINIALMHRNDAGDFKLYFTNISVVNDL